MKQTTIIALSILVSAAWFTPSKGFDVLHQSIGTEQLTFVQDKKKRKKDKKPASKGLAPGVEQPMNPKSVAFNVQPTPASLKVNDNDRIVFLGAGMASRAIHFGHLETELFQRFGKQGITIRNMGDEGNTPGFRPHPGRGHDQQYAFPGAKELVAPRFTINSKPGGHYETPDQWLTRLKADTIIAFFGFNSAFDGPSDLDRYKKELEAFLRHTLSQLYNGESIPQLALVSPTAIEDLSASFSVPDGSSTNANLELYTNAMAEVAKANGVLFFDAFTPSKGWYASSDQPLTTDGALLNDAGYRALAPALADAIFGSGHEKMGDYNKVHAAVMEKNRTWLNYYKMPNGVHVHGRRYNPYGPDNYPFELKKSREMTEVRDFYIKAAVENRAADLAKADAKTMKLPDVKTNYTPSNKNGTVNYREGKLVETKLKTAEGYKVELFASEERFPDLANPAQIAFDNKGRLWVATMASYPHYRIGDPLPQDKLIIFEDTNNDGKADKQINFADDLHIPIGFEIAHDGVYVSQSGSLVFLKDEDGDDRYDHKEILLSGFDDHDTHHAISAFCADPSGAIMMGEGVFLHSNVETVYGPQRGTNGGFFRYSPQRKWLRRETQFNIPNPWGVAYDDYGQDFFLFTSSPSFAWMAPGRVKARYGANMKAQDLLTSEKVRPTSGVEFVSSRHFPDEVQGDVLINNNIGFLGIKQHKLMEDGTGYKTEYRQDLLVSEEKNFRPTDLEFAPDGSLYVIDWHNALIGHMQHSARDPNRDHKHGRIYRVTYPSRPLVKPAKVAGASIDELLENLKLPEYRTRYRTRRELRGRDASEVSAAAVAWASKQSDERHKLEALWVTWGADQIDTGLLAELLQAKDHRVRAAAVRVAGLNDHKVDNLADILQTAASDDHGRVRLETVSAASYLPKETGEAILAAVKAKGIDSVFKSTFEFAEAALKNTKVEEETIKVDVPKHLKGADRKAYIVGAEIYAREAHCGTCHQPDGQGLPSANFPPLDDTRWVNESPERLIKLTLKGLVGPIEVKGKNYVGAMTAFEKILTDEEIAAVLTYVRNSWNNKSGPITADQVKEVRESVKDFEGLYNPADLLKEHPHQ